MEPRGTPQDKRRGWERKLVKHYAFRTVNKIRSEPLKNSVEKAIKKP